jgi:signal transduction histidine kinase
MSLSPLLLEDELFVVSILRDTVARAQEDAAKQRTELLVILGQLAAAVSHEIRNPLQSLSLHIELLEEALRPSGPLRESFATIKTELARLHSVVEDYLSLARVPNVRREPIAVGAMLEAIVQEQQAQATARRVTLHLEGTQTLGHAALHLFTFRRAVLNLLANALEADAQRQPSHPGWPADGLPAGAHRAGYWGGDDRRGAATAVYALIYHQAPRRTDLGLYVVREILKAHRGTVEATSTPRRGTIFTIRLPLVVAGEISTV